MGAHSYRGRFAPSPTGPLHAGSLVAALASWLDARAHGGQWLVRIEDTDTPRCQAGADQEILRQLATLGLLPDAAPIYQSSRSALYQSALDALLAQGHAYPCACSRSEIEAALANLGNSALRHADLVYPGTCRNGLRGRPARAVRLCTADAGITHWQDQRLGAQQQDVAADVGDFVLRRADSLWAYQLAVVVDDAAQGITHVVRGEDLADNTARQILLQRALGLPTPQYRHVPLVLGTDGQKLSKQNGAAPLDLQTPLATLQGAAHALGLPTHQGSVAQALNTWASAWATV